MASVAGSSVATSGPTRVLTFARPLEFDFEGNVNQNAITLGDVDNDGLDELIVGNDVGRVAIFKGSNPKPVRVATEVGLVATLSVGDLLNIGRNVLLVVTAYGKCHIYDLGRGAGIDENEDTSELKPFHTQILPANVKCAVIGDINGDKMYEVAFALTDRVVRTYKWVDDEKVIGKALQGRLVAQNKWELSDQIGGIILHNADGKHPALLVSQPGATCFTLDQPRDTGKEFDEQSFERLNKMSSEYDNLDRTGSCNPKMPTEICGSIELDEETSFDQFKSMSSAPLSGSSYLDSELSNDTLGYVLATVDGIVMLYRDKKILWKVNLHHPIISISLLYIPIHKSQKINSMDDLRDDALDDSSSETSGITPPIRQNFPFPFKTPTKGIPMGMSTPSTPSKVIPTPNTSADQCPSRAKKKSMVTKIVACSSDGKTFIMNVIDGVYSLYKFHEPISTCATGFYGYKGKQHSCIAYSTFSDKIFLYHEVGKTLQHKLKVHELLRSDLMYVEAVKSLGIDIDNKEQMRQLHNYLLYGIHDFGQKQRKQYHMNY